MCFIVSGIKCPHCYLGEQRFLLIGHLRIKFQCKAGIKQYREDGSETFSLISYFVLLLKLYNEEIILTLTFTNNSRLCKHLRKEYTKRPTNPGPIVKGSNLSTIKMSSTQQLQIYVELSRWRKPHFFPKKKMKNKLNVFFFNGNK